MESIIFQSWEEVQAWLKSHPSMKIEDAELTDKGFLCYMVPRQQVVFCGNGAGI